MTKLSALILLLFSGLVIADSPTFLKKGQVFYEELGMSFDSYRGIKVKLTVIEVDKKSGWVLFERSFENHNEQIWLNTAQMKQLVIPATSKNN